MRAGPLGASAYRLPHAGAACEVERTRALIEARALGRRIGEVDDADGYVCRPHPLHAALSVPSAAPQLRVRITVTDAGASMSRALTLTR
jgi:hypothetical protein